MPHHLLPRLREAGIIATLRAPSADTALRAVDVLVENGISAIEVTYTTPAAGEVIAEIKSRFQTDLVLGAGTLTRAEQVHEAADAGADFLVSPGYDPEVYSAILATGALSMIGGYTPTEVQRLAGANTDIVKFFPGSLGGPSALKALRGPFPDLNYVPTGGVSSSNLAEWFKAGAIAVGAGSELVPAAALEGADYATIAQNARSFVAALQRTRTEVSD